MRDYSRVHSAFWTSDDIRRMPEDAKEVVKQFQQKNGFSDMHGQAAA